MSGLGGDGGQRRRREAFDEDADGYDRVRPVVPPDVLDGALATAGVGTGSTVAEVGPGTGQATRHLAERGLRVVAVEIGPRLAERARQNLAGHPAVAVETTSFEDWEPGGARFDAVLACNSFHWVDPEVRFTKAADVLAPGGHLVVISTPWAVPPDADRFWWAVQDDWVAVGGHRVDPATKHPDVLPDIGPEVRASGRFEEPTTTRHLFAVTFSAEDYATNLSTQSAVKDLPAPARAELVDRVRTRIQGIGGHVTAHLLAITTVARRGT